MTSVFDRAGQSSRLRAAMARKGLRQRQVAETLGITQASVSEIIRGSRPGTARLPALATLLDVPLEWITTGFPRQEWEAAFASVVARLDDTTPATGARVAVDPIVSTTHDSEA